MYICGICKNEVDSVYFKNSKEVCEKCYRGYEIKIDKEQINPSLMEAPAEAATVAAN